MIVTNLTLVIVLCYRHFAVFRNCIVGSSFKLPGSIREKLWFDIEDEIHFLFDCAKYSSIRDDVFNKIANRIPNYKHIPISTLIIQLSTWIYVIDFKRCKNSFRSYQVYPQGSLNFHLLPTPSPNDGDISVLYLKQFHCVMNLNELVHENLWLTRGFERLLNEFWVSRYFSKMLTSWKRRIWGERYVIMINVLTQASKRNFV